MNRDEILAKSRMETTHHGADERELHEALKAADFAMAFGGVICFVMVFLKTLLNDVNAMDIVTYTCFCIYSGMGCFRYLWLAVRVKKPAYWILTIFGGVLFALSGALFVMELLK